MLLIEPLGLLSGRAAADAVSAGLGHPLAGGPAAFALARLHGDGPARLVAANAIPSDFAEALFKITVRHPVWAGMPADRPALMGILNVTPDSFSDGGDHFDPTGAVAVGRAMALAGADVIDIGGESTRPGADVIPTNIEQARVLPVVAALAAEGLTISVDTRNAATMAAALDAGARIINDVSGLAHDPDAAQLVRGRGVPVVVMHMRGTPRTMAKQTHYDDVAVDVTRELAARLDVLAMPAGRVAVDPGIGFAKGPGQNETLLARLAMLLNLGAPIVVGASRKGFIARSIGEVGPKARLPGSVAAAAAALLGGATIIRVHDVAETRQFMRVWQAIRTAG